MINVPNLDDIPDEPTKLAFQWLVARLSGFLSVSFDEDGNVLSAPPTGSVEVGMVFDYAGGTVPNRYLACDGSAVSRITYKALFERIGTTWGIGDGSTTFNLPPAQGRASYGVDAGTVGVLGTTFGSYDHTHSVGAHTHSISSDGGHAHGGGTSTAGSHSHSQGAHSHALSTVAQADAAPNSPFGSVAGTSTQTDIFNDSGTSTNGDHSHGISSDGSHAHGGNTGSSSGGNTGANNPPGIVFTKMIYVGVETS